MPTPMFDASMTWSSLNYVYETPFETERQVHKLLNHDPLTKIGSCVFLESITDLSELA